MSRRGSARRHCRKGQPIRHPCRVTTHEFAPPDVPGVQLTALAKSFRSPTGPVHAVRGIDVTIWPGETVALLGPNGAGKSTTIDMILGLQRPERGTATVFGMPPDKAVSAGLVGAMLQTGGVIPYLSVRELLTMVASIYPRPMGVDDVIALTRIGDFADRRTNKLSGGQT